MGSMKRQTILSERIAEILGTSESVPRLADCADTRIRARNAAAFGSMLLLAANPVLVSAAGLGELKIESRLGQPLQATIPLRLTDGEMLPKGCVRPAPADGALRNPPDLRVASPARKGPGTFEIRVTTANPLHEPMYELSLMVKCQGSALLVRQYVLMLDLPGTPVTESVATQSQTPAVPARVVSTASRQTPATTSRASRTPSRALQPTTGDIEAGSLYRVSRGDTLSTIARRITGRLPDATWNVADRIFADNPRAFIRGNPDMIKLGSLLKIPDAATLATISAGNRRTVAAVAGPESFPASSQGRAPAPQVPVPQNETVARSDAVTARDVTAAETATPQAVAAPLDTFTDVPVNLEAEVLAAPTQVASSASTLETATSPEVVVLEEPAIDSPFASDSANAESVSMPAESRVVEEPAASDSSSWLAILIGLLLGAIASVALFRERLLGALGLRRPRSATANVQKQPRDSAGFDLKKAAAAFVGKRGTASKYAQHGEAPLPISGPAEDTYIVEASVADSTLEADADLHVAVEKQDPPAQAPVEVAAAEPADDDSAELAALFETGSADLDDVGPAPAAQADDIALTQEALPVLDEGMLDPTAEMPASPLDEVFDPTGGAADESIPGEEQNLTEAFDENLTSVDPDEMFATGRLTDSQISGDMALDALAETINDAIDAPNAMDLSDLPQEDDELSETLQEALELLERDYEDEFTASQIIERSALEKSLKEDRELMEAELNDDDDEETAERKIS